MAPLNAAALLKEKNIRLTDGRKEVLEVLQNSKVALSHSEVDEKLPTHIDRITIYRTLLSFKKKGLIHSIIDPHSGAAKYLFNSPGLPKYHAHFKCTSCDLLICLQIDTSQMNAMSVPEGFHAASYSFIIEGLCDKCRV
jgi:Fur family transcriptional regulator, ferric uptake regulator